MNCFKKYLGVIAVICTGIFCTGSVSPSFAADSAARTINKKILVVYYSRSGNTKKVSTDLAKRLGADIEEITDKKDRSGISGYMSGGKDAMKGNLTEIEPVKKNPAQYDIVIIGTPIWSWDMSPAIRTYISEKKNSFKAVAFFTTSGSTKYTKTAKYMETLSGKTSTAETGFVESDLKEKNRAHYEEIMTQFIANISK